MNEMTKAFMDMPIEELKEFVNANEQTSFAEDSKVRMFLNKYDERFAKKEPGYGLPFAFVHMYVELSNALYQRLVNSSAGK